MVVEENNSNNNNGGWAPIGSPMNVNVQSRDNSHLTNFESSVNAVSFGFVATAILISMFLLMAIFERFLRPNNSDEFSPSARRTSTDLEPQMAFPGKLGHPSPKSAFFHAKSAFFLWCFTDLLFDCCKVLFFTSKVLPFFYSG
ncbi:hypothetical protein AAHE18_15G150800 [Arachis hypogaea]|uniref:Uncharacterized protein n=2 Tax=Arachis hypogaea TaxID=3818 RepID=A0A444Z449_ARAHY|nr:hypothetical protein Ahy_B05g076856 isoform A [Arachis hypogaea]